MCIYIFIYTNTHPIIYTHTYICPIYVLYMCVCVCIHTYMHTHCFCFSGDPNTDMKFIFKSLWKIERTCSYLDMNYGHTQYQDTLLVSESLKRHLTPLLESSSVFTTHCFLGFSVFLVLHGPPPAAFWT